MKNALWEEAARAPAIRSWTVTRLQDRQGRDVAAGWIVLPAGTRTFVGARVGRGVEEGPTIGPIRVWVGGHCTAYGPGTSRLTTVWLSPRECAFWGRDWPAFSRCSPPRESARVCRAAAILAARDLALVAGHGG
jgi:hypothetical protein